MMRLFISQPMRGKTDEEILAARDRAIKTAKGLIGENITVINSFFENAPADAKPLWFLGESLKLMSTADVVYFVDDWREYRGCLIEYRCAQDYGLEIIEDLN